MFLLLACVVGPMETGAARDTSPTFLCCDDEDGDGYGVADGDCDSSDPLVNPGAQEVCDDIDNNCDGQVNEGLDTTWYEDPDADGYGGEVTVVSCDPGIGWARVGGDCDNLDAATFPAAVEACDGIDNDCDGVRDDACDTAPAGEVTADAVLLCSTQDVTDLVAADTDGDGDDELILTFDGAGAWLLDRPILGTVDLGTTWDAQYPGSEDFPLQVANVGDWNGDGREDLAMTGGLGVLVTTDFATPYATSSDGLYPSAIAGVGDVDGDGIGDVAVGSYHYYDADSIDTGAVLLFAGGQRGELTDAVAILYGEGQYAGAGASVGAPGDLDGDGLTDLVVGSAWAGEGGGSSHALHVEHGPITGTMSLLDADTDLDAWASTEEVSKQAAGAISAGDTDGDGLPELWITVSSWSNDIDVDAGLFLIGDPPAGAPLIRDIAKAQVLPPQDHQEWDVSGDGDLNGDGRRDLAIANNLDDLDPDEHGHVFIGYAPFAGVFEPDAASMVGTEDGQQLGFRLWGAGDGNNDGFDDLLIEDSLWPEARNLWLLRGGP